MRQNDLARLKSIIKDNNLKKVETIVKSTLGLNYNSYLDYVEPIYALGRLYSYLATEKDKDNLLKADITWTRYIIEENQCSQILPYVQKYGRERTILAVKYLLETRMWVAPKGNAALKSRKVENFKGLADIDETIAFMDLEGMLPPKPEEEVSDNTLDFDVAESDDEPSDNIFSNAKDSAKMILAAVNVIQENIPFIQHLFDGNNSPTEAVDKLTKEFDAAMQKLRDENLELTKTKARLTEENSNLRLRCKNNINELTEVKEICSGLRAEISKKDLEIEGYRKEKERNSLPTRKVIPESKFRGMYGIGDKTMGNISRVLSSYDIIIDTSR